MCGENRTSENSALTGQLDTDNRNKKNKKMNKFFPYKVSPKLSEIFI